MALRARKNNWTMQIVLALLMTHGASACENGMQEDVEQNTGKEQVTRQEIGSNKRVTIGTMNAKSEKLQSKVVDTDFRESIGLDEILNNAIRLEGVEFTRSMPCGGIELSENESGELRNRMTCCWEKDFWVHKFLSCHGPNSALSVDPLWDRPVLVLLDDKTARRIVNSHHVESKKNEMLDICEGHWIENARLKFKGVVIYEKPMPVFVLIDKKHSSNEFQEHKN